MTHNVWIPANGGYFYLTQPSDLRNIPFFDGYTQLQLVQAFQR